MSGAAMNNGQRSVEERERSDPDPHRDEVDALVRVAHAGVREVVVADGGRECGTRGEERWQAERRLEREHESVRLPAHVEREMAAARAALDEWHEPTRMRGVEEVVAEHQRAAGGPAVARHVVEQHHRFEAEVDGALVELATREWIRESD